MAITASPALTGFTASKILWVRNHEPECYAACRHILLPKDYIRYRLTGELATDASDASGMQLLDIAKRDWSPEVLEKLEIDRALLAPVYESPEVTGGLSAAVAAQTGLRPGLPVVGGAGDNAASAVGTGVVRDGNAFVTIGTSGVIFAHASQMNPDPKGRIHTFCCAVPGAWHVMAVTQAAGLSLKWLRGQLGYDDYDAMTALAATAPIGSRRLLYLPYLMGERTPHLDADARGAFVGLAGIHGHADLIRAVLEGVAFSLADGMAIIRSCGVSVKSLMACGGGGSSAMWRQIIADVLNTPLCTASSAEGGAFGAALRAGVGAGVYASVPEACEATIRPVGRQEPDPARHAAYGPYYQLYRGLYPALLESFRGLSAL
jgi:xylulokinase